MALRFVDSYHHPRTVEEAIELLAGGGDAKGLPVAGGTSLTLRAPRTTRYLVDLGRVGLDTITKDDDGLTLGAMVTLKDIISSEPASSWCEGLLEHTAATVAHHLLRNRITVGGNAVGVFYWSDLPSIFLALGAVFTIQGPDGTRTMDADAFYAGPPQRHLAPGELVTAVTLPPATETYAWGREKFVRTKTDYSMATITCVGDLSGETPKDVKVVASALSTLPQRLTAVEQAIEGAVADIATIEAAAAKVAEALTPMADLRASKEYRLELAVALTKTALCTMLGVEVDR